MQLARSRFCERCVQRLSECAFPFQPQRPSIVRGYSNLPVRYGREKRVRISSSNGEKIVREALRMVLEAVYEPYFLVYSHGHRPGLGEHSALREIRRWVGISWFLKFKVQSCNEERMVTSLMEELQRLIGDRTVLDMIRRSITLPEQTAQPADCKITQLGRLLNNIYLHHFDLFVARTISLYKRGEPPSVVSSDGTVTKDSFKHTGVRYMMIANYPEYRRLYYVRHGNHLMMGFIGTKEDAVDIFYDAKLCIEGRGINMNRSKRAYVADSMQNPANFLGFRIVCEDPADFARQNPYEVKWKAKMYKLDMISKHDKFRRMMRKYVVSGEKTLLRACDPRHTVRVKSAEKTKMMKCVVRHLQRTIIGPLYRNIYHVMSPREILLNKRTQKVIPSEITEAAKQLEESLRSFVASKQEKEDVRLGKEESRQKKLLKRSKEPSTPPEFYAPMTYLKSILNKAGFLFQGKPTEHPGLNRKSEMEIVEAYAHVANSILNYYKCSRNLDRVKRLVDCNLRFSCLRTLGSKHQANARESRRVFTDGLIVPCESAGGLALRKPFPSSDAIAKLKQEFMFQVNPAPPWKVLQPYCRELL